MPMAICYKIEIDWDYVLEKVSLVICFHEINEDYCWRHLNSVSYTDMLVVLIDLDYNSQFIFERE